MRNLVKRHWRVIIIIALMAIIFCFSASPANTSQAMSNSVADLFNLPHQLTRKIAHFILFGLLGAAWYYYLRALGRFTPGFTSLGSLLFVFLYALIDEFHQTFIPGRSGQFSDILLDTAAGLVGIIIFGTIYYLSRSKQQKQARRKQVDKIWANNDKLLQKFYKTKK